MGREKPDYVDEMLSEKMTRLAGIFSHESVAALLAKIEKAGTASEMDNMVLAAVISTHLVHSQFIENNNSEFRNGPLRNLRIIEEKQ
jgi:hypothetical protein